MGSQSHASAVIFLVGNLLFCSVLTATACHSCSTPPTHKTPSHPSKATCPRDALKLGVCANLLSGLIGVIVGTPKNPCCSLFQGLVDLEAAACLCTALKANVLGINLNVPLSLSLLLNTCGYKVPSGFQCAY